MHRIHSILFCLIIKIKEYDYLFIILYLFWKFIIFNCMHRIRYYAMAFLFIFPSENMLPLLYIIYLLFILPTIAKIDIFYAQPETIFFLQMRPKEPHVGHPWSNWKVFILPRVAELLNHKEKQIDYPLLDANIICLSLIEMNYYIFFKNFILCQEIKFADGFETNYYVFGILK